MNPAAKANADTTNPTATARLIRTSRKETVPGDGNGRQVDENGRRRSATHRDIVVVVAEKEFDADVRHPCLDGTCIGLIDSEGICNVCGRRLGEPPVPQVESSDDSALAEGLVSRRLCCDGNCTGVVGDDSRCMKCGRVARKLLWGTVVKVPDSTPGVLVLESGIQQGFVVERFWRSPVAPGLNRLIQIELDHAGNLVSLTVSPSGPRDRGPGAEEHQQSRGSHASLSAQAGGSKAAARAPEVFAAIAFLVGAILCIGHITIFFTFRALGQEVAVRHAQSEDVPGADSVFELVSSVFLSVEAICVFSSLVGAILVVVAWSLWRRRSWARSTIVVCGLSVLFTLVVAYSGFSDLKHRMPEDQIGAMQSVVGRLLALLDLPSVAAAPFARGFSEYLYWRYSSATTEDVLNSISRGLIEYAIVIAALPAVLLGVFGRDGARKYFPVPISSADPEG